MSDAAESSGRGGRGKWIAISAAGLALVAATTIALGLLGRRDYPQDSPDALLNSARQMVVDGRADRLPQLVWTGQPEARRVLKRFGRLLGNLQGLGETIHSAFPDEIAEVQRQAEAAAARGEGASMVAQLLTGQTGPRRGRGRGGSGMEERMNMALRELFADPYGWLARSEGRLAHEYVTDDIVGLSWDGRGVIGLQLVEREGKWYLDSPTNLPMVRRYFPPDADAYRILESLVATLDNAVQDLDREVKSGEIRSLATLSSKAGEKAAPMFIFGVIAYGKFLEERDAQQKEQARSRGPAVPEGPGGARGARGGS